MLESAFIYKRRSLVCDHSNTTACASLFRMARGRSFPTLSTDRLALRPLRADDEEFLARLDSDPLVMEHIGEGSLSIASALDKAKLEIQAASLRLHPGKLVIEIRGTGTRVGWVELAKYRGPRLDESLSYDLQIGYQFAPDYWGLGYATEAVQAAVSYAFEKLQLRRLVAYARIENHRSARVLAKAGFVPVRAWREDDRHTSSVYVVQAGSRHQSGLW
ncbi:MAG: GNAT family N-acetyltransferase [Bryobacteraceae bacterium]